MIQGKPELWQLNRLDEKWAHVLGNKMEAGSTESDFSQKTKFACMISLGRHSAEWFPANMLTLICSFIVLSIPIPECCLSWLRSMLQFGGQWAEQKWEWKNDRQKRGHNPIATEWGKGDKEDERLRKGLTYEEGLKKLIRYSSDNDSLERWFNNGLPIPGGFPHGKLGLK